MEESVFFKLDKTVYGETEKGNNKMLLDNVIRAEFIVKQHRGYIKQFYNLLETYLKAHKKVYIHATSIRPMECYCNRAVLIPSGALDHPYCFAGFSSLKNPNKYKDVASLYFKLEETRLRALAELSSIKEKIRSCEKRLEVILLNLENNYAKTDYYKEKNLSDKLTQSQAVRKVKALKKSVVEDYLDICHFNHVPTQDQVSDQFLRFNQVKQDYFLKCSGNEPVKFV